MSPIVPHKIANDRFGFASQKDFGMSANQGKMNIKTTNIFDLAIKGLLRSIQVTQLKAQFYRVESTKLVQ
jgi:hypothetical protein